MRSTAATSWVNSPRTAQRGRPSAKRNPVTACAWNALCTIALPSTASTTRATA